MSDRFTLDIHERDGIAEHIARQAALAYGIDEETARKIALDVLEFIRWPDYVIA